MSLEQIFSKIVILKWISNKAIIFNENRFHNIDLNNAEINQTIKNIQT